MRREGSVTTVDRGMFPAATGPVTVHSLFPSAANLQTRGGLVTLAALSKPAGPGTAVLDLDDLHGLGLAPGLAGELTPDRLTLGQLDLDLKPATSWQPPQPEGALRPASVGALAEHLSGSGLGDGAASGRREASTPFRAAVRTELDARTRDFTEAVRKARADDATRAASRLLGLGQGLTPSGDDWLSGFALTAVHFPGVLDTAVAAVDAAAQPGTTVDLSLSIIRNALQGRAIDPLHRLLAALTSPSRVEIGEALALLADVGHSSGIDMALGLLAAAQLTTHPQGAQ